MPDSTRVKYYIADTLDDRRLYSTTGILADTQPNYIGKNAGIKLDTILRWKLRIPPGKIITDATIAYYVAGQVGTITPYFYMMDSTNVQPFITGTNYNSDRHAKRWGSQQSLGDHPGTTGWKRRNITSWLKIFYEHDFFEYGKYFGIRMSREDVVTGNYIWIFDSINDPKYPHITVWFEDPAPPPPAAVKRYNLRIKGLYLRRK